MSRNILILDDQEDILLILEREFRRRPGLTVTSTSKPADALRLVAEKRIELVICDVRLGLDSGFDVVRALNRNHPGIGAILMSAYRSPTNHLQARDLGVLLFLEKPFPIPRLMEEVDAYFNRKEGVLPASAPLTAPIATPAPAAVTVAVASAPPPGQEANELSPFKPQDLVQLFCLNGRNVVLTVASGQLQSAGNIYIQRGRVLHAVYGEKTGDDAFHELMQLSNPLLKVKDWAEPVPVTIETSWEHLLLQSAIHTDHGEDGREEPALPDARQRAR